MAGDLSGKLVISMINSLKAEGGVLRPALDSGSAAEELAQLLPGARIATAFTSVPVALLHGDVVPPVDILVAADSKETYEDAAKLVKEVREVRPLYAGPLDKAAVVEAVPALVLNLAKLNGTGALTTKFVTRKG